MGFLEICYCICWPPLFVSIWFWLDHAWSILVYGRGPAKPLSRRAFGRGWCPFSRDLSPSAISSTDSCDRSRWRSMATAAVVAGYLGAATWLVREFLWNVWSWRAWRQSFGSSGCQALIDWGRHWESNWNVFRGMGYKWSNDLIPNSILANEMDCRWLPSAANHVHEGMPDGCSFHGCTWPSRLNESRWKKEIYWSEVIPKITKSPCLLDAVHFLLGWLEHVISTMLVL